jgi:hypothetical protein
LGWSRRRWPVQACGRGAIARRSRWGRVVVGMTRASGAAGGAACADGGREGQMQVDPNGLIDGASTNYKGRLH